MLVIWVENYSLSFLFNLSVAFNITLLYHSISLTNQGITMARSKPLPVALNEEQHAYLESKGRKAEYLRKLLIIDMYKEELKTNAKEEF